MVSKKGKQVAIVTGGSRGIGYAIAQALIGKGMTVVVCSTKEKEAAAAAKTLGADAFGMAADVSNPKDVARLFDETLNRFGRVDFLVNNAGMGFSKPLSETTEEEIARMVGVNTIGMLYACRQAALRMEKGAVVNIGSFYAKSASGNVSVYAATKHAVIGLSKALSYEWYGKIKVFVVNPGAIETKLAKDGFGNAGGAPPEKIGTIVADLLQNWEKTDSGTVIDAFR